MRLFNLTKVIGTKEKHKNYTNSIFPGDMKTCCAKSEFRAYQETFGEYVNSTKQQILKECG